MSDNHIAVFGHVGCLSSWQTNNTGGYRRTGVTAEDAMKVFRQAYEYQENGWSMDEREFDKFVNELEQKY